ncbi:MAG: MCE family protein [Xanthomonadaceae bacterium]|nr:MCE family protein [Xanthomonadaceae bacterium]
MTKEVKVGALVAAGLLSAFMLAWFLGIKNPFSAKTTFHLTYHFAGGIDVGSPVRVSGIKVGRVENIEFFAPQGNGAISKQEPGSDQSASGSVVAPLKLRISISDRAMNSVRQDSKFYINMAGIIGERYIEITPGTVASPQVKETDTLAGIDPPRIDQLLSQSFDLAGKIAEIVEKNKGDITRSIEILLKLSENLNKTLGMVDKSGMFKNDLSKLISNLIEITSDMKTVTGKVQTPEGKKALTLMYDLLMRLEPLDEKAIRKFLQDEGVKTRVKMF